MQGSDGNFYGSASGGGSNGQGSIFRLVSSSGISNQPSSLAANIGGGAGFTVAATGIPPLYYQWQKNGTNLPNGGNVSGANSASLALNPIAVGDTGNYDVIISNFYGVVTSAVPTLTACTPVSPTNFPSVLTAAASPYLVSTNVVLGDLSVQPGVSVLFNGAYSLTVTGLFQASGTIGSPVLFAPATNAPAWQGLRFVSASTNGLMSFCRATGAVNGALRFTNTPFALNNCTIDSNSGPMGGGIYSDSNLELTNCNILNNTAFTTDVGSPYHVQGGGIYLAGGSATLQSCLVSNNTALMPNLGNIISLGTGGGVDCETGNLVLNNCVVISNRVSSGGGWNDLLNWTQTTAPTSVIWQAMACSANGNIIYAGGPHSGSANADGIFGSTDAGATWQQTGAPGATWRAVACSSDGVKLVGVDGNYIYTSTNSGANWTQANTGIIYFVVAAACSSDGTKMAVVVQANPAYVMVSTNTGATWAQYSVPATNLTAIASSADGNKLVLADEGLYSSYTGSIFTSTNGGVSWVRANAPAIAWGSVASSADGTKLVAAVGKATSGFSSGGIYVSSDSGLTWQPTTVPNQNWSVASSADGTKLVGVQYTYPGGIYLSTNSGSNWVQAPVAATTWASVACSADGTKLFAGTGVGIYTAQPMPQTTPTGLGGGVYLGNGPGSSTAAGCSFLGNSALGSGGAICLSQGSLLNCVFSRNQATNGGALFLNGNGPLGMTNCLLTANVAMAGGALYSSVTNAIGSVENTTVVSNSPDGFNGYGGSIHDSILFFNGANQIVNGSPTVTYSDVNGGHTGTGNLNLNPQFADTTNYLLSMSSPAIDAGDPATQYYDLVFPPSLGGDRNDMGAYGGPDASLWTALTTNLPVVLVNGQPAAPLQVLNFPNTSPPTISFTNGYPGGSFEYTLDGSNPLEFPTFTAVPFVPTQSAVIRVVAYPADYSSSRVSAPVTVNVLPYCTLAAGTAGGGAVSPTNGTFLSNSVVMLTANNAPGWTFLNWTGDISSTNNPLSLTLNGSKNVQAVFGTPLSASPSGSGSVTTNPVLAFYPYGSTPRLFAVPTSSNAYFRFWGGAAAGNTFSPLDFIVTNASPSITAVFGALAGGNYSLTLLTAGPGSASRNPQSSFYASGSIVSLTATPNSGDYFTGWSGDASGMANPLNVTMNSSKFITANFSATSPVTNMPPSVTITNPVNNAVFVAPTNLTINISASDSDGTVAQVVLFANTNQLAVLTGGNFNFVWTNATIGTNILTAIATDNGGLSTISAPVTVTVQPSIPQVALTSPTNNASYLTNAGILVSAIATDADNALAHVELYSQATNGQPVLLSAITNPPYNFTWSTSVTGAYTLTARAYDTYGQIVTSAPVNITVMVSPTTNPPVFLFSATNFSVNESNGSVNVTVLNNGDLSGLVNYQTADGTAFGGSGYSGSYTIAQGSLLFAAGQHSTNINIAILDNFINGPDIQFSVQLFNPSAGVLGTPATTTVTIHQNDAGGATNSLLTTASPTNQPADNAQLVVVLTPSAAAGQWRFPWDLAWRNSGDTVSNLVSGNYPLVFKNVSGYLIPLSGAVAVTNGGTTFITNQYLPGLVNSSTNGTGSITVNMAPNSPPGDGWRFIGETAWRGPGSTASSLVPDIYNIEFKPVSSYATPPSEGVQAVAGQGEVLTVNYLLASSPPGGAALPAAVVSSLITDLKDYPYGFNGQLHTDTGYGSGVAVRETVVLTAAHMVFDDETQSYVQQAYWSFQEETGVFQPEPLAVRGWYVLSGYASQRTNDLQTGGYAVDQSSPQSREEDVAALYFLSPAARGGYGGYLASDVVPNPYLTGGNLKMLVGYPVDGSAFGQTVQPGLMYATPSSAVPTALVQNSNDVYTGSWFLSYPGNSGGPFYVQFNGYYYPAGVYLGTLGSGAGSVSLVRAINSGVVNMINLAASEGDAGTNNTGGGVLTLIAGQGLSAALPAYVQVSLGPPAAVQAGAGWRLQGDASYGTASNYTRSVTTTNGAKLEFKPLSGWNPPAGQTIQLVAGSLTIISNQLYTIQPPSLVLDKMNGLRVTGPVGVSNRVDFRTNLYTGQWLPLRTNVLGAGFTPVLPWPPTNTSAAYYRAVLLLP